MAAAVSEKLAFDPFWSWQQEGVGGGGGEKESAAAQPTPQSTRSYVPIAPLNRKHAPLDGNIASTSAAQVGGAMQRMRCVADWTWLSFVQICKQSKSECLSHREGHRVTE